MWCYGANTQQGEAKHGTKRYMMVHIMDQEAAKTREGSVELQRILKEGKLTLCQQVFEVILGSIFQVMTNEYAHHIFRKLLEVCHSIQLNMIFSKLASHERLFIDVALHKHGSTAVQALIKRLKRSGFGHIITNILSKRFFELMTSAQGQYVLYDALLNEVIELATSQYGCISLNTCLNCVGGINRSILLHRIAEHSDIISHDPWGHYVIQHVLTLHDDNISRAICIRLERHYLHLAGTMGGSHVVENCLKSSEFGMRSVVGTLLERESKLVYLASHQFGNYVVQKALKVTKKHNNTLYESLVMVLKTRNSAL
ncbi:unnamed protein product [Cuscuta europaea]|uniref:PUM-HD domain-containing protein n=1 Tax=Cuscuta europaea TaxID=41803 RepID=A0A9P0Z3N1_CUSEU|nr:unnamed protein product [Cuscuta europaea]